MDYARTNISSPIAATRTGKYMYEGSCLISSRLVARGLDKKRNACRRSVNATAPIHRPESLFELAAPPLDCCRNVLNLAKRNDLMGCSHSRDAALEANY